MKNSLTSKDLAFVCDDLTEFFVIKKVIDELIKQKISLDIIVPFDSGYNGLSEHTIKTIRELGYSPINDAPQDRQYKILLTPYPGLNVVRRAHFIYHIRYPYGALSTKPNPVYLPSTYLDYDAVISFSAFENGAFEAYGGKNYTVPYWRYYDFKKEPRKSKKPVLLVLPTFGKDTSSIGDYTKPSIEALREHFYIITKAHHAVHFGLDGKKAVETLKYMADEYYDSDTPIDSLLKRADIVLSDNSGAIFESICAGIPVALFAKQLNSRHLKTISTPQQIFVDKGFIPHTDKPEQILPMLFSMNKYLQKQKELKNQLFLKLSSNPYREFTKIIKEYLKKDETKDYRKILHDILVNEWYDNKNKIQALESINQSLDKTIDNLHNSTSWKITAPLRKIMSKINRKKNV